MSLEARAAGLRRMLEEALELLRKGDAVQGAEKLYKVAEDAVKALSELRGLPEHEEAARKGRWQARLLHEAARRLARDLRRRGAGRLGGSLRVPRGGLKAADLL